MNRLLATSLLLALSSAPAGAYQLAAFQWPAGTDDLTLYAPSTMQTSFPNRWATLLEAADLLSSTAADFELFIGVAPTPVALGNNRSEVFFTKDSSILCGDDGCAIAFMSPETFGANRVEADVVFNGDHDWVFTNDREDNPAYNESLSVGDTRPLLNTAVHEFLHAAGLKHEDEHYNIMGNAWNVVTTNGTTTETFVGEDPTQGLIALYGEVMGEYQDVSVSHWKQVGSSDGYSNHGRVQVTRSDGSWLSTGTISTTGDTDVAYTASPGDALDVEVTVENNGFDTQEVDVSFYLSSNDLIYPGGPDLLIGTRRTTISPDQPKTLTYLIRLPLDVTGEYWLGVEMDAADEVVEVNEDNNVVYLAALDIQ